MAIATTNPATGKVLTTFPALDATQIDAALSRASQARAPQRSAGFEQRAHWMNAAADLLDAETGQVAELMTTEMGKTLDSAKAEVSKCAVACRYYADNAVSFLADDVLADASEVKATRAYVTYEPLGVVLAVMPWNFPLWQAMRFAAPALMAGNVGLLKHASNVPQTALYLQDVFTRAGFGEGAFQTLLIGSDAVAGIVADDRLAAVTLTGSEAAGRSVAEAAGRALKKSVLELGGSDPFVVLPSADLDAAADVATTARVQNNGQSCIAAKRFIVHADVYEEFAAAFTERMAALTVGDPMAGSTDVGPLATEQGRTEVVEQVADAREHGADILCGGDVPDRAGWFYPPTVVAGITESMRMYGEEVFGPVAGLYRAASYDDAIALANATRFGLGSNVWTTDEDEQRAFIRDSAAGAVFVNGMTTSYPQLPFGGVKDSGYGRELAGHGIREFCNAKTVWID